MVYKHSLIHLQNKQKDPQDTIVVEEIRKMILDAQPEVLYTHNLADKHTHIGVSQLTN